MVLAAAWLLVRYGRLRNPLAGWSSVLVIYCALIGAASGALFAMLLSFVERRGAVATWSRLRVVLWGAISSTVVAAVLVLPVTAGKEELLIAGLAAALGGLSAHATLAVARHRGLAGGDSTVRTQSGP